MPNLSSFSPTDFFNSVVAVCAIVGFLASFFSIYLQFRVKGSSIALLNDKEPQQLFHFPYDMLPEAIRQKYPRIVEAGNSFAVAKLIFANSGDRTGLVTIQKAQARITESGEAEIIKVSCEKYILVPALGIVEAEIVLRGINLGEGKPIVLDLELELLYGGYNPDNTKYQHQLSVSKKIPVTLMVGDPNSLWWISGEPYI